jgi:hypothetical protein
MHSATNVKLGRREERPLLYTLAYPSEFILDSHWSRTGVHTVADAFCIGCDDRLGWFYHKASDSSQKYKEGGHHLR